MPESTDNLSCLQVFMDENRWGALTSIYEKATRGAYTIDQNGQTCALRTGRDGATYSEPVSDFVILPQETILRDDGLDRTMEYRLIGYDYKHNPLPLVSVPAAKFATFGWIVENWPGAVIFAGQQKRERLREAVQMVERETADRRTVFSHSGWRNVGGKWAFLHSGGAIGTENACVELSHNMRRYDLTDATPDVDRLTATMDSLNLLHLAPVNITFPLLSTMYLAPLCSWLDKIEQPVSHVLVLHGKTQSKKSTLSALFLSHFGRGFTAQSLPCNFQSTANAIRGHMFEAADIPLVVDDFHPSPTSRRNSVDAMTDTCQQLVRAWGDHADRQRMNADGATVRKSRPPRGLGIITAEFLPDLGESGLSRCYVIELKPGSVSNLDALTNAQRIASDGHLVCSMRHYIEWLAKRICQDNFLAELQTTFLNARDDILSAGDKYAVHGRLATSGAHLIVGLKYMLQFMRDIGVISVEKKFELYQAGRDAILYNLDTHERSIKEDDPLRLFSNYIGELLDIEGSFSSGASGSWLGDGCCGIVVNGWIYARPATLFGRIAQTCKNAGTGFPISQKELWKRLHEAGVAETPMAKTVHIPGTSHTAQCIKLSLSDLEQIREDST